MKLANEQCYQNHLGAWAIDPQWFTEAVCAAKAGLLPIRAAGPAGPSQIEAAGDGKIVRTQSGWLLYQVYGGVGIVSLDGPLMKFDSKYGGTNTVRVREALRVAVSDEDVQSILLRIDSPGGSVPGTKELADDVLMANGKKPVNAFIEDLGASAAYWVASQARRIFANEMALVGSIGTYAVVWDESKAAEMQGIAVHVVSSGKLKGQGEPGTPVTPELLAYVQDTVDDFNKRFLDAVESGRGLSAEDVSNLADGRTWIAPKAKKLGLIDQVGSFDEVLEQLGNVASARAAGRRARAALAIDLEFES